MLIKGSALNVLKRTQEHFKNICFSYVFLKCSFQDPFQHSLSDCMYWNPVCKMSTESMGSLDIMYMDSLDNVHGLSGKSGQSPWILWTKSREPTQTGQCPWTQWTLSTVSLDNVHGLPGQCPWT